MDMKGRINNEKEKNMLLDKEDWEIFMQEINCPKGNPILNEALKRTLIFEERENKMKDEKTKEIITDFLKEMGTQDNRATASPFYYVIKDFKLVTAMEGCHDKVEYRSSYYDEIISEEEYGALPEKDTEDEYGKENFIPCYVQKIETEHGMFLTESDAKEHLKRNSNHYSSEAHTYVKHAWRAPQLESFINALFEHFEIERQNK